MTTYRVREWALRFENDRSRVRDRCGYVCLPNKNGVGKQIILRELDGTAIFGFFALLCEEVSKKPRPREGWLTHDGLPSGSPWTPAELTIMTGADRNLQDRAFEVLSRPEINWLEINGESKGSDSPPSPLERKGKEGKGKERKGKEDTSAEPATPASAPPAIFAVPEELTGLAIYEADAKLCMELPQMIPTWKQAYPGVDVRAEIRKAHAWEQANPTRRKTPRGRMRFLNSWMERAQNDGGRHGTRTGTSGGHTGARTFAAAAEQAGKFDGR
jgi:hypothetical protein